MGVGDAQINLLKEFGDAQNLHKEFGKSVIKRNTIGSERM